MRVPHAVLGSAVLCFFFSLAPAPPPLALRAGTAERLEFADLSRAADLILDARVRDVRSVLTPEGRIETEYELEVERTFWGEDLPTRSVRLPGGVLPDGSGLLLPGVPRLTRGERSVLFLSEAGASGMRMPVGLGQGRFEVVSDAHGVRHVLRNLGDTALTQGGGVAHGEGSTVTTYAAFAAALEVALVQREAEGEPR